MINRRASLALSATFLLLLTAACHKKVPPPPPPPPPVEAPPPAAKPVLNYFTAEPTTVTAGQPSSLRWSVTGANNVTIDNQIGQVSPDGRRGVYPTATTTYHLTATNTGGTTEGDATVTVSTPPPPQPAPTAVRQQPKTLWSRWASPATNCGRSATGRNARSAPMHRKIATDATGAPTSRLRSRPMIWPDWQKSRNGPDFGGRFSYT